MSKAGFANTASEWPNLSWFCPFYWLVSRPSIALWFVCTVYSPWSGSKSRERRNRAERLLLVLCTQRWEGEGPSRWAHKQSVHRRWAFGVIHKFQNEHPLLFVCLLLECLLVLTKIAERGAVQTHTEWQLLSCCASPTKDIKHRRRKASLGAASHARTAGQQQSLKNDAHCSDSSILFPLPSQSTEI